MSKTQSRSLYKHVLGPRHHRTSSNNIWVLIYHNRPRILVRLISCKSKHSSKFVKLASPLFSFSFLRLLLFDFWWELTRDISLLWAGFPSLLYLFSLAITLFLTVVRSAQTEELEIWSCLAAVWVLCFLSIWSYQKGQRCALRATKECSSCVWFVSSEHIGSSRLMSSFC